MKTALILTTVNVPTVLALYRKLGPDVFFFIAGDRKTPDAEVCNFLLDIPNHAYYGIDRQHDLDYKCSHLIGENCVERRNIALLEAVKGGADVIVTIDDDNIPMGDYFYEHWRSLGGRFNYEKRGLELGNTFSGIEASSPTGWFDPGALLVPQTKHRGFPISIKSDPVFESVVDAKIGVAQGLCLGDPDIDAVTRIATAPIIHSVSELGRAGIVTDPRKTKTVFNTQNTAFIRELAPAMFQPPGVGRYSDIYASLICQRVMRERELYVHFGQPFVWQQRNKHNLIRDLRDEIDGMENVVAFSDRLDCMSNLTGSVLKQTRRLYQNLLECSFYGIPELAVEGALAFLDDIEAVL